MPRWLAAFVLLALAACSDPEPPAPSSPPPPAAAAPPPVETKSVEAEAPKADPNAALAAAVKRALEGEGKVQAAAIDVTAADGTVTLWGTAASDDERARAAKVARSVQGVKSVANKIAVVRGS